MILPALTPLERQYFEKMGLSPTLPIEVDDVQFAALLIEARMQHPHDSAQEIHARALARCVALKTPKPKPQEAKTEAPHIHLNPIVEFGPLIREVRRWGIIIAILLLGLLLLALPGFAQIDGYQIQNGAGAVVKHWGGGVVKVKCGANLTCSFATGVLTITAGAGGSVAWGSITGTLSAQTDLQTALDAKAPIASPTFTGTVTMPTPFTLGAVSVLPTGTELNFVDGVTSAIQTQLDAKAPLASPTFTGTVTFPTPFTLGAVSVTPTGTELNFVDGVTSAIQTQLDAKAPLASPVFTTSMTVPTSAGYAPTADGSVGYDLTQDKYVAGGAGAVTGTFPRVLYLTNCTTEANCTAGNEVDADSGQQGTTETNFASTWPMPANFLVSGKAIQVCGVFQATASGTPPTIVIRFKAGSTVLVANTAVAGFAASVTRGFGQCYQLQGTAAPGAAVSVEAGYGTLAFNAGGNAQNNIAQPVTGVATNGALTIQISAQWGTATTGNTLQLHQFWVLELN